MTRDDIIRMAQMCDLGRVCGPLDTLLDHEWEDLHRFAVLVAAAEREACADIAYQWDKDRPTTNYGGCIARQIRARGGV